MSTEMNAENTHLREYGIFQDQSNIRAHVSIITKSIYVFKTEEVKKILPGNYRLVGAKQPGVEITTAEGWLVPVEDIPDVRRIEWNDYDWWNDFSDNDLTSEKGRKAALVVMNLLKIGRFPLWVSIIEPKKKDIQMSGVDVLIVKDIKIQVKCDWKCGPKSLCGSGNFFIQKSEINPNKLY